MTKYLKRVENEIEAQQCKFITFFHPNHHVIFNFLSFTALKTGTLPIAGLIRTSLLSKQKEKVGCSTDT